MIRFHAILAALIITFALVACVSLPPTQAPTAKVDTGHTGGSIVVFDPQNRFAASGGWEGGINLWSVPDAKRLKSWRAHAGTVNGIVIGADSTLITAGYEGTLARWDARHALQQRVQTGSPIRHMLLDSHRARLITGHEDGAVRIWQAADFAPLETQVMFEHPVMALAIDAASGRIAASSYGVQVMVWMPGSVPQELEGPPTYSRSLAFTPDGERLYGSGWFRLFRWRIGDGRLETVPTPHHGIIKSIDFSADGTYLASISRQTDSAVLFLNPEDGSALRSFGKHALCGGYIALSADERFLATTADDAQLRIWALDANSEQELARMPAAKP